MKFILNYLTMILKTQLDYLTMILKTRLEQLQLLPLMYIYLLHIMNSMTTVSVKCPKQLSDH